ncbi:DNA recombination protein RmuC [Paludibacillus litoralis]|uniref:DNA recombination protein RmuC n=1 Tax=Paludibacillus litoralis TaxID=3133267 RepID=UPI0039B778B3
MMDAASLAANLQDSLPLLIGTGLTLLILLMLIFSLRAARRGIRATEPIAAAIAELGGAVRALDQGQNQLAGGLRHVSEAQAAAQARMIETMERRLETVQKSMGETLHGTSQKTTRSLAELQERLAAIDKAQTNIERLSGDVLSLQDILSNKQARGAFGEIQLNDIVSKALPPDAYAFQATLSNGRRADCLIHLPNPPGPIVIDAKFPLESYESLRGAASEREKTEAARGFRIAVQTHIRAIAERYVEPEETADGALMFLPSEAVYAELHSAFPDVVREGFARRVWIVSPTTCMATLHTMRAILKDARMREQSGAIRRELGLLTKDMERLVDRVAALDRHFEQARQDVEKIKISASKAGSRAEKLESFEFDEPAPALPKAAE